MSLANNLINAASSLQQRAKTTSVTWAQRLLRLVSGLFIALVLALILQQLMTSSTWTFLFFTFLFTAIIYRLLRNLSVLQILIFNIICVLAAVSLRLYIMIAPTM